MAKYYYETLTPTDYGFLVHENPIEHMHVTGLATFKAGPLANNPPNRAARVRNRLAMAFDIGFLPAVRQDQA